MKLAAIGTWLASNAIALLTLGLFALGVLFFFRSCQDDKQSADEAVMQERIRTDSVRAVADSVALADANRRLEVAMANTGKSVDRWREVKVPVYLPSTATAHDTIQSLAKRLSSCYEAGDSLAASVVPLQSACTAYRDSATKSIATLNTIIARKDSLAEIVKSGKRVQPYSAGLYDIVNRRPVFRVGTTAKAFWKIHGMAEAEYSIPSNVKTESGDGLRVLAGVRVNF